MRSAALAFMAIFISVLLLGCGLGAADTITPTGSSGASGHAGSEPYLDSDLLRPDPSDIHSFQLSQTEKIALQTLADIRSGLDLPELATDETLCALAYIRAKEAYLVFSHTRPNGASYDSVLTEHDYVFAGSAEVLMSANIPMSMADFFSSWDRNPDVAAKLTDPTFLRVGIAFYHKNGNDIMVCLLAK